MSTATNGEFNESPNHFMVLDAVSRGTNNVDKITRVTKLQNYEMTHVRLHLHSEFFRGGRAPRRARTAGTPTRNLRRQAPAGKDHRGK